MISTYKKIIPLFLTLVIFTLFVIPNFVFAQSENDYTLLAPIPCVGGEGSCSGGTTKVTTFEKYIPGIFNLAIGFSAAFAVLNLVYGGFLYLSSDAIGGKSEGKSRLKHSIQGLVLVIAAWLILFTINPKLLEINFDLSLPQVRAPFGASGTISSIPGVTLRCETGTCVPIPNGLTVKSGAGGTIHESMAPKLSTLDSELEKVGISNWTITEAYPPTRKHQSSCHEYGTCIDASAVSDNKVYSFITASTNSGLKAVFEVETPERKDAVIRASCGSSNQACTTLLSERVAVYPPRRDASGNLVRQITAEHFSVYNQ